MSEEESYEDVLVGELCGMLMERLQEAGFELKGEEDRLQLLAEDISVMVYVHFDDEQVTLSEESESESEQEEEISEEEDPESGSEFEPDSHSVSDSEWTRWLVLVTSLNT